MWKKSYTKTFKNIDKESIWNLWTDINNWPSWNPGIESCTLDGAFKEGGTFTLKAQKGPAVKITLIRVEQLQRFTDCTNFLGAKMYGDHIVEDTPDGLKLTTTVSISGPLSFIWRKLVAEDVVAKLPQQTDALVTLARKNV